MTDQQTPSFFTPDGQKLRVREVLIFSEIVEGSLVLECALCVLAILLMLQKHLDSALARLMWLLVAGIGAAGVQ